MLLADAIAQFLDARIAEGRSYATVKSYRTCLRSFQRFVGGCELAAIDEPMLRGYLANLRLRKSKHDANPYRPTVKEPLSPETIRTYYRHIRAFLRWCVEEGLLTHDPTRRVKMPPPVQHKPKDLLEADYWKMVKTAGSSGKLPLRDKALILFLGDTGVRVGGVISLTIDRVDLDARLVEVIEKGDKSRVIPISGVTAEALREWLAVRPDRPGNPYVFLSYQGGQLTKYGLYQAVKRIAERAGVVGRSNPHAFRHFFGHKWMETGGGISQLSDMLGHSQIHVTKQFYLRFDIEAIRREHSAHSPLAGWAEKE